MPCGCDLERERIAAEIRARVTRVKLTEAMRAEHAAKQACYEHERRAWLKRWYEQYGFVDSISSTLDQQHVITATLLL